MPSDNSPAAEVAFAESAQRTAAAHVGDGSLFRAAALGVHVPEERLAQVIAEWQVLLQGPHIPLLHLLPRMLQLRRPQSFGIC